MNTIIDYVKEQRVRINDPQEHPDPESRHAKHIHRLLCPKRMLQVAISTVSTGSSMEEVKEAIKGEADAELAPRLTPPTAKKRQRVSACEISDDEAEESQPWASGTPAMGPRNWQASTRPTTPSRRTIESASTHVR